MNRENKNLPFPNITTLGLGITNFLFFVSFLLLSLLLIAEASLQNPYLI